MATPIYDFFKREGPAFLLLDEDLRGGFRVVADLATRDAIPLAARKSGMLVRVQNDGGKFSDWTLPFGKPLTNANWTVSQMGGGGDFIPTNGGPLKGPIVMDNVNGGIDFNGMAMLKMQNNNATFVHTAVPVADDPEPRGMFAFNDGVSNTVEINAQIGQIVCKREVGISSDRSLKHDIRRVENALEILRRMYGYTFEKEGCTSRRYAGHIAQEVLQAFPEACARTSDGKLAVFYGSLGALFNEGIVAVDDKVIKLLDRFADLLERLVVIENALGIVPVQAPEPEPVVEAAV